MTHVNAIRHDKLESLDIETREIMILPAAN